jgi:hypothetical protein
VAKFEKGHPKLGGRKKGTRNKSSIMEKFEDINFDVIAAIIESIAAQPEYMRADTLIKMLEFVYPKKKSMDLNMVSDEELKQILVKKLQEKQS